MNSKRGLKRGMSPNEEMISMMLGYSIELCEDAPVWTAKRVEIYPMPVYNDFMLVHVQFELEGNGDKVLYPSKN